MGYKLETPVEYTSACKNCILYTHGCPRVVCGGMSITDPNGIGVEPLLGAININKAHI